MRAIVWGAGGAMGQLLQKALGADAVGLVSLEADPRYRKTFEELGPVEADVVIDFSHHAAVADVLTCAKEHQLPVVIGTTGHTPEEKALIVQAARQIPIFFSGNMSMGIALLCRLAKEAARSFPEADIEIVEIHHNRKADAPSGTAHMLFEAVQEVRPQARENCGRSGEGRREAGEVGISSVRMGGIVGIHEVHIATPTQTLTLRHEARDRAMFADGAVEAARFLIGRQPGLYTMQDLLEV